MMTETEANELTKPDDATLILKRTLNAPRKLAFEVWTAPEHFQQWMQPEPGMTIPFASMDLRVGGRFRIQMKSPEGGYFTAVGEFQEVKAPERLVYTWDWEKDGSGTECGEVEGNTSLITVESLERGERTEMTLMHSRFASIESRDNHARGWGRILDGLAGFVEKA